MESLADLPTELVKLIAIHLGREALKALRLTDRALSVAATAQLFKEIHISPNTSSFDRAHCIAGQGHLNRYVRSLVYHFGKLADIYVDFEVFKREYFFTRRTEVSHDPYEINAELLWNYSCWLEELDAQRTFVARQEFQELQNLCRGLPRLEAISTILDEANPFGDQEDYIGKRTGMALTEDDGWLRFANLFAAAVDKPLHKVSARSIQWHDLSIIEDGSSPGLRNCQHCLSRLTYLELGIYRMPYDIESEEEEDSMEEPEYLRRVNLLDRVLENTHQLETLKLDFNELPFESLPHQIMPISEAIFKHHWPRLKRLKLEALCVYEDAFVDFLRSHRATLTTLCIGDIELEKRAEEIPSILGLFLQLHDFLRLQSCKITGNFTNRVDQSWYVDIQEGQPGCLRDQIEDFLCGARPAVSSSARREGGKECSSRPIEDFKSRLRKVERDGNYKTLQDESFQWSPELFPDTPTPSE